MMADIIGLVMKPRGSVRGLGRGATLDRSILGSTATSLRPRAPVRRFKAAWMIWPRRLLDRVSRREDPTDSAPFPLPSFPLPSFPLPSFPFLRKVLFLQRVLFHLFRLFLQPNLQVDHSLYLFQPFHPSLPYHL